jgi:hypothetical protein
MIQDGFVYDNLYAISFPEKNIGYILSDFGGMLRTLDSGETWRKLSHGTHNDLNAFWFTDANNGVAVGGVGTIIWTTNGSLQSSGDRKSGKSGFTLYPNPAKDEITVSLEAKTGTTLLTILDLNGREMISRNLTGTITRVDISKLADGIYVAKLLNRNGISYLKFIKN